MGIGDGQPASIEEEMLLMIQEGFEHIFKVLDEMKRYLESERFHEGLGLTGVEDRVIEFRQWLDAPPKDSNG